MRKRCWQTFGSIAIGATLLTTIPDARADLFEEVDVVAADFASPDPARRKEAVDRLSTQPLISARPLLIQAFDDPDLDVKARATVVAGRRGLKELLPRITERLTANEPKLRVAAAEALAALPAAELAARPALAGALERTLADADGDVRLAALTALLRLPENRLGTSLDAIARAIEDERPAVRLLAVEGAGRLHSRQLLVPLLGRISDPAREVRAAALEAIANINDPRVAPALLRSATEGPEELRAQALMALGRLGSPTAVPFLRTMLTAGPERLRSRAAQALALIGRRDPTLGPTLAVELVGWLRKDDLRATVSEALVALGDAAAPAIAEELLRPVTADPELLVNLLDQLPLASNAPALLAELRRGRVRKDFVARALGRLPALAQRDVQPALIALLYDDDELVRRAAGKALDGRSDERAVSVLTELLDARDPEIALFAVRELGRLQIAEALPRLVALLGHADPRLLATTATALGQLSLANANNPELRVATRLEPLLGHAEPEVRAAAARAIARTGDQSLVPLLCRRLRIGPDEAIGDVLIALEGPLRAHPDGVAREVLLGLAEKRRPNTADAALAVLFAMRDPSAAQRLDALVKNHALAVSTRAAAVRALSVLPDSGPKLSAVLLGENEEELQLEAAWGLRHFVGERAALDAAAKQAASLAVRDNARSSLAQLGRKPTASFAYIVVEDADGSRRPSVRYRIDYADGAHRTGRSDSTGTIHDEAIAAGKLSLVVLD